MSSISALLAMRSPSAIPRLVIAVVVDSVKRVIARWSVSHIGNEVSEPIKFYPSVANIYSTSTIVTETH